MSEATTYHAIAQLDEVGGRFAVLGKPVVVGTGAQAPVAGGQRDVVGDEPPLSPYDNPGFEPSTVFSSVSPVEETGEPTERTPSRDPLADVESGIVGSPSLSRRTYRRFF
jgi:hypothetical protein